MRLLQERRRHLISMGKICKSCGGEMEVDIINNEFVCLCCQGKEDIIGGQTSPKP